MPLLSIPRIPQPTHLPAQHQTAETRTTRTCHRATYLVHFPSSKGKQVGLWEKDAVYVCARVRVRACMCVSLQTITLAGERNENGGKTIGNITSWKCVQAE
jgi:hypothetical protein